jgi:hypothetical protein
MSASAGMAEDELAPSSSPRATTASPRALDASAAVLSNPQLLALIMGHLAEAHAADDFPMADVCVCACVSKGFNAAATDDALWRAALLRHWPSTEAVMAPAPLPCGAPLRALFRRRAGCKIRSRAGDALHERWPKGSFQGKHRFETQLTRRGSGDVVLSATFSMSHTQLDANDIQSEARRMQALRPSYTYRPRGHTEDIDITLPLGVKIFPLDVRVHASRPFALAELPMLGASLCVFRRCQLMGGGGLNDQAVMHKDHPVVLHASNDVPPGEDQHDILLMLGRPPDIDDDHNPLGRFFCYSPYGDNGPPDSLQVWYMTEQVVLHASLRDGMVHVREPQNGAMMLFTAVSRDENDENVEYKPRHDDIETLFTECLTWRSDSD